jgi:hypothetical protein
MTQNLIRTPAARMRPSTNAANNAIHRQFARLYAVTENSPHLFGSPLGPFALRGAPYNLARFVYFGPQSSDDSVRLAFQAGFDGTETRGVQALAHFLERLALTPDLGQGLNLSFFPLVNPSGLEFGARQNVNGAELVRENWEDSNEPEIVLLRHDAHVRGYHGFIRIESSPVEEITAIVRQPGQTRMSSVPAMIAEEASDVFPLRWQRDLAPPTGGPLSIADDFALQPFELVLRFPAAWSDAVHREAVTHVLRRFIVRYRATLAYGLNL